MARNCWKQHWLVVWAVRQRKSWNGLWRRPLAEPPSYAPIVQLRRDEFPELPWPASEDLFQLLWCPRIHFWGNSALGGQSSGAKIVWRTEASIRNPLACWERSNDYQSLNECALNPEEIIEYPQALSL